MPNRRLIPNYREGAFSPTDEGWWRDVLHDPRTRLPREKRIETDSLHAHYRLDRQRFTTIVFACSACPWTCRMDKDDLIETCGPDANVALLAKFLALCGERTRDPDCCWAYCVR